MKLKTNHLALLCIFIFLSSVLGAAQSNILVESRLLVVNEKQPWWFHVNQGGGIDQSSTNVYNSVQYSQATKHYGPLKMDLKADMVIRGSDRSALFLREAYIKFRLWNYQLDLGRFYDPQGLNNDLLGNSSMGSIMLSKNATPFPKIAFRTDGFLKVPLTFGFFKWRASFAHGWLDDNRFVKGAYVHQKTFYLNLDLWVFQGYGGLIHNNTWGGTHPTLGRLPQSFRDYISIVTGLQPSNSPKFRNLEGELTNVIGNSNAAYDFGFSLHIKPFLFKAYRIFYHEDTVSLRFRNAWDGIWGGVISLDKPVWGLSKIGHEFMYLVRQGKRRNLDPPEPVGTDDAYNHSLYQSGWTYEGRVLGNPLILTNPGQQQPYFFPQTVKITNNIVVAHHSFIEGRMNRLVYALHHIYARNYGNWRDFIILGLPYSMSRIKKEEFYIALSMEYAIDSTFPVTFLASLATDLGQLYTNRYGLMLGLRINQPLLTSLF